jgi:hypothetical protein
MGLFEMGYSYVDTVSHGGPFRNWLVKEVVGKRHEGEVGKPNSTEETFFRKATTKDIMVCMIAN